MTTLELQLLWVRHKDPCTILSHSFQHPLVIHRMCATSHLELVQAPLVHTVPFHHENGVLLDQLRFRKLLHQ